MDDLQWADRFTLFALPALASQFAANPVGLLLAQQPLPNPPYVKHAVAALANAGAAFMTPHPLSSDDITGLAADALQAEPGSVLLEKLAGAGGNPLVALDFVEGGPLFANGGGYGHILAADPPGTLPPAEELA